MTRRVLCSILFLCMGLGVSARAGAQQSLTIGNAVVQGLTVSTVTVSLTSTAPTEGFVLAIGYDTSQISVTDIDISALVAARPAELVVGEVFDAAGGATLGVVLDANAPFAGQTLPAGANQVIAQLEVMADLLVQNPTVVALEFADGVFNSPPLSNMIVQGGLSLGAAAITLVDGSVTLQPAPPDSLSIGNATIQPGQSGCAPIRMSNQSGPVQGFVLAIEHAADLTLASININGTVTQAEGAEFIVPHLLNASNGGTLGVVMDFNAPFTNKAIPVGVDQHIANFCYTCDSTPVAPAPPTQHALNFVNGMLGVPPLSNVIVVAGLSISPALSGGLAICQPTSATDTEFFCGIMDDEGTIVDPVASPGDTIEFCFFWSDPTDNIHGFQLAVCFDCNLHFEQGTFSVDGTILASVGAEFVNHNISSGPNANGYCELVAGILLDALPPFNRQTVPSTGVPLKMASIEVTIDPLTPCNTCLDIFFCDGATGAGQVPIENIVVVNGTESVQDFTTHPCQICVEAERQFVRGDCNSDLKLNIADSATILAHQFQGFVVACRDACDTNDDGKINLADSVYILNYMFKFGPPPPQPYPAQGPDTTVDDPTGLHAELDCVNGRDPCLN